VRVWLEDVKFFDEKRGVAVGDRGTILLTSDGGATWRQVKTNLEENLYALSLADEKIGYAVGGKGSILKTEDGGETWIDQESSAQMNLYAITAPRRDTAIAVGEYGAVLLTQDGGKTWKIQPNVTSNSLQAIAFLGGTDLWIAGRGGAILKRNQPLSPMDFQSPKIAPVLRLGTSKPKLRSRTPLVTITDDGDIPTAIEPKKPEK